MKEKATEAWRILNTFVGELVCSARSFELYEAPGFRKMASERVINEFRKMSTSYLLITLTKWVEFYDKYHNLIPTDIRPIAKSVKTKIEQSGVVNFRNNVVGHIWDKKAHRPLGKEEIEQAIDKIFDSTPGPFLLWINDQKNNIFPKTIVSITEEIRRRIELEHGLSEKDKFPWK